MSRYGNVGLVNAFDALAEYLSKISFPRTVDFPALSVNTNCVVLFASEHFSNSPSSMLYYHSILVLLSRVALDALLQCFQFVGVGERSGCNWCGSRFGLELGV